MEVPTIAFTTSVEEEAMEGLKVLECTIVIASENQPG